MRSFNLVLSTALLVVGAASLVYATPATPFDEETLDEIDALNRAISSHYEELRSVVGDLDARREVTQSKLEAIEEELAENSAAMGDYLLAELAAIDSPLIKELRGRGLFIGIEIEPSLVTARAVCEALMDRGLLSKETHDTVVRLAPPLVISKAQIDWAVTQIREVMIDIDRLRLAS